MDEEEEEQGRGGIRIREGYEWRGWGGREVRGQATNLSTNYYNEAGINCDQVDLIKTPDNQVPDISVVTVVVVEGRRRTAE